jgi:hypothetical protein
LTSIKRELDKDRGDWKGPMKARKLLENAALGPDELAVLYAAFDEAWELVKARYATTPQSVEVGRLRLASALLAAHRDGVRGADALKAAALKFANPS